MRNHVISYIFLFILAVSIPPTVQRMMYWKATGPFFGKFAWKILYRNLDLKGEVQQGPGGRGSPCSPPLRSRFWYGIFPY